MLSVLERLGLSAERQSLIVNRHQRIAGSLALADVADRLGRPIDHVFPYDKRVIAAANSGRPVGAATLALSGFARRLQRLVGEIESLDTQRSIEQPRPQVEAADEPAKVVETDTS